MAYSILDDVKKQLDEAVLIQLVDDEDLEMVEENRVTRAIADADSEIDTYLSARYTLPLATVPAIVLKWSVDIAIYNLYARRFDTIPEIRKKRYDDIIRLLIRIADGQSSLGVDVEAGGVAYSGSDQVMTAEKLANF